MDFSLISSINVGSTSISSVYYQSQKIWPSKVSFPNQIVLNPAGTFGYAIKGSKDNSVVIGNLSNRGETFV